MRDLHAGAGGDERVRMSGSRVARSGVPTRGGSRGPARRRGHGLASGLVSAGLRVGAASGRRVQGCTAVVAAIGGWRSSPRETRLGKKTRDLPAGGYGRQGWRPCWPAGGEVQQRPAAGARRNPSCAPRPPCCAAGASSPEPPSAPPEVGGQLPACRSRCFCGWISERVKR
jgi:hypothetical protein